MALNENDHSGNESNSAPTEGGSPAGEGRGRRRRRRSRRPDERPADAGVPNSGVVVAHDSGRSAEEHAGSTAPNNQSDSTGEPTSADGERKRRRRKKKRTPEQATAGAAPQEVSEDPVSTAPVEKPDPRGRQADRRQPAEKKERAPRGSVLQRRVNRGEYTDAPRVKEEPAMPSAPVNAVNVDAYVNHHKGWQREVLTVIRGIIKNASNEIDESILWSQPVYSLNGPVCYLKAFQDHVNFGFWRGTELTDPEGLLVGDLTKMRHITLRSTNDVNRDLFDAMVRQAVRLNREKGDPTLS